MNNTEIVSKISQKSGVNMYDCQKVLDAFEEVLSEELAQSKDVRSAMNKVYNVLHFFKTK